MSTFFLPLFVLPGRLSALMRLPALIGALLLASASALAQTQPGLYDPEPPANSAYVRVVHGATDGAIDVLVDGKLRASQIARGIPCDYLVLPAGTHQLELRQNGKSRITLPLDAPGSHALTLAFASASSKPIIFEDKTIANKLKATLTVYHLHADFDAVDIATADGKLVVFPALAAGATAVRAVNPITIELVANKAGSKLTVANTKLAMVQGGSYSVMLLPDSGGKMLATSVQNKIERYTGK